MNNNAPTLNPNYNRALASWAKSGHDSKPECENCGKDMTGQIVHETNFGWYCDECESKTTVPSCERVEPSGSLNYVGNGYARDSSGLYREAFWAGTP
jgi:ribosomal protein L37AE/L43A